MYLWDSSFRIFQFLYMYIYTHIFFLVRTSEHKWGNTADEAGQEWVERERANQAAVGELHDAGQEHVAKIGVNEFESTRRARLILIEETAQNLDKVCALSCSTLCHFAVCRWTLLARS